MANTTPVSLYSNGSIPTTKSEIVSADTATTRVIRKVTFTNNSGGTLTVDLYFDPTGTEEVQIVDTKVLINTETWSCIDAEGHVLSAAGTIDVAASGIGVDLIISAYKII